MRCASRASHSQSAGRSRLSSEEPPSGDDVAALTRSPGFWVYLRYAALFGVVLAFAALAYLGLIKGGTKLRFTLPDNPGWFDGSLWWVAVTAGAGVLVGVLRRAFAVPAKLPGTVEELKAQRVEPATVPGAVAVSLVSLVGGASLGPEAEVGDDGRGLGTWLSERRKLTEDERATNTLSGASAAYGGLLSSPILATILVFELARPKAARLADTLFASLLSSTVAFAVYFPIAGIRGALPRCPSIQCEDWQLLAAIPLGLADRSPRADHRRRDRTGHAAHGAAGHANGSARGHRGLPVRAGRRGATADAVHGNRSADDGYPRRGNARRRAADRGCGREDPRVRGVRGHRLHRRPVPRDAVHRRHERAGPLPTC